MKTAVHSYPFIDTPVKEYLEALQRKNYSPKSIESYQNALMVFADYLISADISRVQDVTESDLEGYRLFIVNKGFANASQYLYLRSVRAFFEHLESTHYIFINPAKNLIIPRYERHIKAVPSEDDMIMLIESPATSTVLGVRDRAILEVLYSCGLRREELVNMDCGDIDTDQQQLKIKGKGSKERMVPVGSQALTWLMSYMEKARPLLMKNPDEQAVWIGKTKGVRLTHSGVHKIVRHHAENTGIEMPLSAHSIRRACATHMLQNGAHPVEIQMLLGHANLRTLSQYLKVTIKDMKHMHERSNPGL